MVTYGKFADIYDSLIYEDIDYVKWSKKILDICSKNNINKDDYLDLGCGTGNMAINIVPYFKRSWCSDLSEEMLIEAEQKFRASKYKTKFVNQDMRFLNLNQKFDLITCTLDCVNYLIEDGDLIKLFNSVKNHLKDTGVFIFDINSEYKLRNILGENIFTYNSDDVVYLWENTIDENVLEMYLTFFVKESDKYERFDETHLERIYSEDEIEQALSKCDMTVINKLDNYLDKEPNNLTERITYIIRR